MDADGKGWMGRVEGVGWMEIAEGERGGWGWHEGTCHSTCQGRDLETVAVSAIASSISIPPSLLD